jgi:hypothetical protein
VSRGATANGLTAFVRNDLRVSLSRDEVQPPELGMTFANLRDPLGRHRVKYSHGVGAIDLGPIHRRSGRIRDKRDDEP